MDMEEFTSTEKILHHRNKPCLIEFHIIVSDYNVYLIKYFCIRLPVNNRAIGMKMWNDE